MKLADGKGELVDAPRGPQFRQVVLDSFPEVASEIEGDDGIHIIMPILERMVMAAVERDDADRARAILVFLDGLLDHPDLDPEIPNAVSISFIEPESLCRSVLGRRVWEAMPPRIRMLLLENKNRSNFEP